MAAPTCSICGAPHTACVPSNPQYVVDVPTYIRRPPMAELGLYEVTVRSGYKTRMKLTDDEAKLLGGEKVGDVETAQPQPVTRPSHAVDPDDEKLVTSEKRAPAARNKARSGDDK